MVHIIHRVGIKAPIAKVYQALATTKGISDWWTKDTAGTSEIGKSVTVRFHTPEGKEVGWMDFEIMTLKPAETIRWRFTSGPEEWIGTEVKFDLHEENDFTIVLFSHLNWAEEVEFKAHCSMKWAIFMLSLKSLLETREGRPSPDDIKIDNWN